MNIYQFWKLREEIVREIHYKELLDGGFEFIDESTTDEVESDGNNTRPLVGVVKLF